MNRSIALFVALAVLVAHAFAIHSDASGDLAAPGDLAYAGFKLARNIAFEGTWTWQYGMPGIDAYPSPLWVWLCAGCERVYWPIHLFAAAVGLVAALLTMIVSSRFHQDRIASLIAPLLLAISGGFAAMAVGGTEWPLFGLFFLTAFASMEKDYHRLLALALVLAGWTRPEGWIVAAALFAMQLVRRRREQKGALWPFGVAALGALALAFVRHGEGGAWISPTLRRIFEFDSARLGDGLGDLTSFFLVSASPALVVFAVWYFFRAQLTNRGRRALELFALWCLIVVASGGGRESFHRIFLPGLPLALIAAQEGMICALNSPRSLVRRTAWTAFVCAILLSSLASRRSRDLGPLPLQQWQAELGDVTAGAGRFGYQDALGRAGLEEELATSTLLRAVGIYLRDQTEPYSSVGTPWPGSIAYLAPGEVWDLLGRATPPAKDTRRHSWSGRSRVDLGAALEKRPDYLVPRASLSGAVPNVEELATEWLVGMDDDPTNPKHIEAVRAALDDYELITVPIARRLGRTASRRKEAFHLLRLRALEERPQVRIAVEDGELQVYMRHAGCEQLADLRVIVEGDDGHQRWLNPRGGVEESPAVFARTNLLLYRTGDREVLAYHAPLPELAGDLVRVRALLLNPGATGESAFDLVSAETELRLP